MKYIYFLRHADTQPASGGMSDHERPLSQQGVEEAAYIGLFMRQEQIEPHIVLCSSAKRTRTTFSILSDLQEEPFEAAVLDELYLATPEAIIEQITLLPDEIESVLVVGHNPGLHQLCHSLAKEGDADALNALNRMFPPASMALFEVGTTSWERLSVNSRGKLLGLMMPSAEQPSH